MEFLDKHFPQFPTGLCNKIINLLQTKDVICVVSHNDRVAGYEIIEEDVFDKTFWDKYPGIKPVCRLYKEDIING